MASRMHVRYRLLTLLAQIAKRVCRNRLRASVALTTTFAYWKLTANATIKEIPDGLLAERTTAFIVSRAAFRACGSALPLRYLCRCMGRFWATGCGLDGGFVGLDLDLVPGCVRPCLGLGLGLDWFWGRLAEGLWVGPSSCLVKMRV